MAARSIQDAFAELDPEILDDMANVRQALLTKGPSAAAGFLHTLEQGERICREHRRSASPDQAATLEELAEGIAAAGEVLQEVCRSVDR